MSYAKYQPVSASDFGSLMQSVANVYGGYTVTITEIANPSNTRTISFMIEARAGGDLL